MNTEFKTGVYFCKHLNGHPDSLSLDDLAAFAGNMPEVTAVWRDADLPLNDLDRAASLLRDRGVQRMVVAGDRPGFVKPWLARVMLAAGLNPADLILISFREHNAVFGKDAGIAKSALACGILGVPFELAALPQESGVHEDTLVIGGGIAGIQASLEIANSGKKVHLVERTGTIGGHMAMFDKTFPTLDCAACILTPKMVEVGQHPLIDLMTYCEVTGVSGGPGDYRVRILKKARRVDPAACIGCGTCSEKCPATSPSEFDNGTTLKKAIYIPFPQAVPNKYLVDAESCTYVIKGKCGVCVKFCPVENCIDLDEKDCEVEIRVGNIIVATGFKTFDPSRITRFGYGKYPNVVTSLEFERLVNAAGPTGGLIRSRTTDRKGNSVFTPDTDEPKSIAIIHCVGSRDENYNKYCSRVCCMYSLKLAHLVREKIPDAGIYEYYIDMRAYGKGYEEFCERVKEEGVNVIRGRTAKVEEKDGKLLVRSEEIYEERIIEQKVDMVILSVGLEPREDASKLAEMLGISIGPGGWFTEANYLGDPVGTFIGGVTVAGTCQGPKDIPDSVAQGSAAASRVLQSIIRGKVRGSMKDIATEKVTEYAREITPIKTTT